jgi:hypothetical protein
MIDFLIFALKAILVALFAVIVGGYAYFVWSGELPNPFAQMPPTASVNSAAASILYLAVGLSCLLAVLAPLIYALRSGDLFTVVVSIVALAACFTILTFSRTVIDMVLAEIVYFQRIHFGRNVCGRSDRERNSALRRYDRADYRTAV